MKKFVFTALLLATWGLFSFLYGTVQGPVEGNIAITQLNGDDAAYAAARAAGSNSLIPRMANWTFGLLLLFTWGPVLWRHLRAGQASAAAIVLLPVALSSMACGPPKLESIVEIAPSETAFMVKLEGDTKGGQDMFQSAEFLDESKIAVKRVSLPLRKLQTGRMPWAYKWIPTAQVIKVDRKPVTREWTKAEGTGTSNSNEAIHVESMDSIGFSLGVNMTTSIPEPWASRFLYNFSGKTLQEVTDQNIRGFVQAVLSREFGSKTLEQGRGDKKEIFDACFKEASELFEQKGVSVDYLGFAEGMVYDDITIQQSINSVFLGEMAVQQAEQDKLAQVERNAMLVSKATAERQAAQEFAKAQEAAVARIELEIQKMRAQALLKAAEKWDGSVPANILPEGSSLLFGLDTKSRG